MDWVLVGNIVGYIAVVENLIIYLSNKRENILIFKLISDVLWAINGFLLTIANPANLTGAIINVIAIGREFVFYYRFKKRWAGHIIWLYVFILATLISPIMSWAGPVSLLPAVGSVVAVIGFYSKKPNVMRYISFLAQGLWLIYGVIIQNLPVILCNAFVLISAVIGLIRDAYLTKKAFKKDDKIIKLADNKNDDSILNSK